MPSGATPLPDCDPTQPKTRSLRAFGPFFANLSAGWTVENDQQTASAYKGSDLQLGMISAGATPSVAMTHKMGLARLNPTTKSVANKLTYTYNQANGSYTSSTSGSATITASNDFTGNKPYTVSSQYWHIVKATGASANTAMSFTCNTNQKDYWSAKTSGTDIGYGKYKVIDIQSDRTAANFEALFSCVKTCQTITLPWYDSYKFECWGASGGASPQGAAQVPGRGGYTRGTIVLEKNKTLYVYVGGQGSSNVNSPNQNNAGGWNGGGASSCNSGAPYCGSGGGGSTDIRVTQHSYGTWGYNSSTKVADTSLRTRIMVAAGGGGCDGYYGGGHGGGTTGGTSTTSNSYYTPNTGATQTSTGSQTESTNWRGYFGYANQVNNLVDGRGNGNGGGGGGGWWGGSNGYGTGGSGGSSFISGMSGCVAINSSGVQTAGVSTMTINSVSYTFTSAVTYGGGHASRPAAPGQSTSTYGDGYAKISSQ